MSNPTDPALAPLEAESGLTTSPEFAPRRMRTRIRYDNLPAGTNTDIDLMIAAFHDPEGWEFSHFMPCPVMSGYGYFQFTKWVTEEDDKNA